MPHYLIEVAYTPEAWATMTKNPQDRIEAVRPAVENLGGRIEAGYMSFGEYDLIVIAEMPGNTEAAAFAITALAGGACKAYRTTPLMTMSDGVEAMQRSSAAGYEPPG